jgi:hypothetical protein
VARPEPVAAALCASLLAACGPGRGPCQPPDPACAALVDETIFGLTRWMEPNDWGVTRRDRFGSRLPDGDVLELGGAPDATIHLRFDDLPARLEVRRATLELRPEDGWSGPSREARVLVHRTVPFRGSELTRRSAPAATGAPVGDTIFAADGPRPLRIDVTRAVRGAQRAGRGTLHLRVLCVGGDDGPPWRWASPRATDPRLRPRLVLVGR